MFHHFTQSFSTFAIVTIGVTYAVVSILVAPNQPRHRTDSNKRATLGLCPPSSASTAESCSRQRRKSHPAVETAARHAACNATPDPRRTPQHAASDGHTRSGHENY